MKHLFKEFHQVLYWLLSSLTHMKKNLLNLFLERTNIKVKLCKLKNKTFVNAYTYTKIGI